MVAFWGIPMIFPLGICTPSEKVNGFFVFRIAETNGVNRSIELLTEVYTY